MHTDHIRQSESESEAVVRALARATQQDPTDITPLAESIDPDALCSIFPEDSSPSWVTFQHDGYWIQVLNHEHVLIKKVEES